MSYQKRSAGRSRLFQSVFAGCIFCILWSCGCAAPASAKPKETKADEGDRRVILGSDLYDSKEEIPEPKKEFVDETGRIYELSSWEAEIVPVTGGREPVSGEILYKGVTRDAGLSGEEEFQVKDEVSGRTFPAVLSLAETEYRNGRWEDELRFTATFHQYGADLYYLGDREIRSLENEDPSPFSAELLALIGLDPESSRVERWEWAGEPYTDGEGTLCRDAKVYGKILVYDCRAVYRGQAKLPDYERFRVNAVYELPKEEPEKESGEYLPASDSLIRAVDFGLSEERETRNGFWEKLVRVVKTCLRLTIGLFLLLLLLLGLRFLLRAAGKLIRRWRDIDESGR